MSSHQVWHVAHIGSNDTATHDKFVADFKQAYANNNQPKGMAMYSHTDSFGKLMAVSITPASIPFCPFSANWSEQSKPPSDFGHVGWVAGDERLK